MRSKYLLVGAVVLAGLSAWFRLINLQPSTLNTLTVQPQLAATPAIDFYKLSLQWPPSTCNSGKITCNPPTGPTPPQFTIHGIWPQDINDDPVPPYDRRNPCTTQTPTPANNLPTKLKQIQKDLTSLWPNLTDPQNLASNMEFWKYEWRKHGTCSDYPTQPDLYFNSALKLRQGLNPVMGLTLGSKYTVKQVADKILSDIGAYPEIACNKNKATRALQLWEMRLCYDKPTSPNLPHNLRNCTKRYSVKCNSLADIITFPL